MLGLAHLLFCVLLLRVGLIPLHVLTAVRQQPEGLLEAPAICQKKT